MWRWAARVAAVLAASVAMLALHLPSGAAEGGYGTGGGSSSRTEGGDTVTGSGSFVLAGGESLTVAFECNVFAGPAAVAVGILPASANGCLLVRNGAVWSAAPGQGAPGGAVTTAGTVDMPLLGTMSLDVCWSVWAGFVGGRLLTTNGCTSIGIVDRLPNPSPTPAAAAGDLSWRVAGSFPLFPCVVCTTTFAGVAEIVGGASGRDEIGTVETAFVMTAGSLTGSAVYGQPSLPYCPSFGSAIGTVRISGPAVGVATRMAPPAVGLVTHVEAEMTFQSQWIGASASVVFTGGSLTVRYLFLDRGSDSFTVPLRAGAGGGSFLADAFAAVSGCVNGAGSPVAYQTAGSGAFAGA